MRFGSTGPGQRLWPVLLLLLIGALVPTACVLWFMGEAMRNERLAAREKLLEAYRAPLEQERARLEKYWGGQLASLPAFDPRAEPAAVFESLVGKSCDSAILYDTAGVVRYPELTAEAGADAPDRGPEWEAAEALEFQNDDPAEAADLYREIAGVASDAALAGQAHIACARCLNRAGRSSQAIILLRQVLDTARYSETRDKKGRLIRADAGLMLLDLLEPGGKPYLQNAHWLALLAADYRRSLMPAAQRRMLMERLAPIVGPNSLPTLPAERLAAEFIDSEAPRPASGQLTRSPLAGVWQLAFPDGTSLALYREARIVPQMESILGGEAFSGATVRLLKPDERRPEPFLVLPAGEALPGWQVAVYLNGPDPFAAAARRRTTAYLWTGVAVALLTGVLTLLVGQYVGRQVRLTRLKNDLIATVSHELKTPLASIRALVDTLLDGGDGDQRRTREYLELIARENLRLSHLIDNFLAFSRMERNRRAFQFAGAAPADIINAAVGAAGERFSSPACRLEVQIEEGLPAIDADFDAMVTVLLNLLDNAWKYTEADKRIALRGYASAGDVCFEVRDNGIGVARRASRRIFDRFYQVDRSLSRQAGGCGLGLSIVKFIVEAHGGMIEVRSQPGRGSVFTVSIPAGQGERVAESVSAEARSEK